MALASMQRTWPLDHSVLIERARSAQMSAVLTCHRSDHLIDQIETVYEGKHHDRYSSCSDALQAVMKHCAAAQDALVRAHARSLWLEVELASAAESLAKAHDDIALLHRQLESQTTVVHVLEAELADTHQELADLNAEVQTYAQHVGGHPHLNGHRVLQT